MRELLELLKHDARRPVSELASILQRSEYEVEKNKIILSYNTLINWEKFGDDTVTAVIEINLTPQREEDITKAAWVAKSSLPPFLKNTYPSIQEVFREARI